MKQTGDVADNHFLRPDVSNLAAFLYLLEQRWLDHYKNIEETVRQVAPFIKRFKLAPSALNPDKIRLEWEENGSDTYFNAAALSDGTLRFICLATLLLQPVLPPIILIVEPELGLHPAAIQVLAGLLESAATRTQLIVATQSVTLINQLRPEHVWVVEREEGQSVFRPLKIDTIPKVATTKRVKRGPDFKHEFEALLFARPEELATAIPQADATEKLKKIRTAFPTPEDIDDDPDNAPSKRISRILPAYQKKLHGPLITGRIGLEILRRESRILANG